MWYITWCFFEFRNFPLLMSEAIVPNWEIRDAPFPTRIKRMDLFENAAIVNIECKIVFLLIWFVFLFPLSVVLRVFVWFTFAWKGWKCRRIMNWPSKFFYSGTSMLLIVFYPHTFIASLAELWYPDFGSDVTAMTFTFALVLTISVIIVIIGAILVNIKLLFLHKNRLALKIFESYSSPVWNNLLAWMYFPLYLIKTFIIIIILFFVNNAIAHNVVYIILPLYMMGYIVVIWPFKNYINNLIALVFEFHLSLIFFFTPPAIHKPEDIKLKWGFAIV